MFFEVIENQALRKSTLWKVGRDKNSKEIEGIALRALDCKRFRIDEMLFNHTVYGSYTSKLHRSWSNKHWQYFTERSYSKSKHYLYTLKIINIII
jgi:hypothetical protein